MPTTRIDHLVVAAHDLSQGVEFVQRILGVRPEGGGRHLPQGTHNKVLRLGDDCYLEVLAIDPDGAKPDRPRWFELDSARMQQRLRETPRLLTWAVGTDQIDVLAARSVYSEQKIAPMQRGSLSWQLTLTRDGHLPGDGLIPFLIQWSGDSHPAASMPESGCRLLSLHGQHPQPETIQPVISALGMESLFQVQAAPANAAPSLAAQISTPSGIITLS